MAGKYSIYICSLLSLLAMLPKGCNFGGKNVWYIASESTIAEPKRKRNYYPQVTESWIEYLWKLYPAKIKKVTDGEGKEGEIKCHKPYKHTDTQHNHCKYMHTSGSTVGMWQWLLPCYQSWLRDQRFPVTLTSWPLHPIKIRFLMNQWFIYNLLSLACHSTHPDERNHFIFGPDANKAIAEGFKRREDENIKETIVWRLRLFAVHQRGLRQGLAGKDKPTETQSAKSKSFSGIV